MKGRRVVQAAGAMAVATILAVGVAARRPIVEKAEECYAIWKYGEKPFIEFYGIGGLCPETPHYLTPSINALIGPCDPNICDCHLKLATSDLLELIRGDPKVMNGKIMVKTTAREHFRIRRLLRTLRSGPSPAEARPRLFH